jgi:hypothetical protein
MVLEERELQVLIAELSFAKGRGLAQGDYAEVVKIIDRLRCAEAGVVDVDPEGDPAMEPFVRGYVQACHDIGGPNGVERMLRVLSDPEGCADAAFSDPDHLRRSGSAS